MQHDDALARAEAAQKRWMKRLCLGSFSLPEAAGLMNPSAPDVEQVAKRSREGKLLAFGWAGELWLPKYQFDGREVLPVIPKLIAVAREAGVPDTDLALWMISGSSLFAEQDSPANHLDTPDKVIDAAHMHFEATW